MKMIKKLFAIIVVAAMALGLVSCGEVKIPDEAGWYASWASAQLAAGADVTPINPPLKESTVRQQIRATIGGEKIKLTLSNEYGDIPARIEAVHIAHLVTAGENAIDPSTDTAVTFGGAESIEIPAGETVVSDEIDFSFGALDDLAITIRCGKFAGSTPTSHTGARCTTWISSGDHVSDESFSAEETMTSWYFISELDVWAEAGTKTLVVFGDSITDGYGSTTNGFDRWSDELARQLKSDPETASISVVNEGIGGNSVFGGIGTAAKDRFERDVLNIAGTRYVIVLIGINDIGYADEDITDAITEQYEVMIKSCHEKGIKIYAGTITPVNGNGYYSELHEKIRTQVNEWIVEKGKFDGVIDFAGELCDSSDSSYLADEYSLDDLHPNPAGYIRMGQLAYEKLKEFWGE